MSRQRGSRRVVSFAASIALAAALGACTPRISETRMIHAAPRDRDCALELMQVDPTSMTFNREWDVLGYVVLHDAKPGDPMQEENRRRVRPRACAMGGTVVAVAMSGTFTTPIGPQSAGLAYMVLRPKSEAPSTPTTF